MNEAEPDGGEGARAGPGQASRRLARRATERIPPRAELMEQAAEALRKGAADIARQVEKYVHDLRVGLEGRPAPRRAAARKTTRRKARRRR